MSQFPFEVVDVSDWEVDADEPAGQEEKVWLRQPDTEEKWLFKPYVEKNGFRQGEDWSEKVSAYLATSITVPCAEVELATRQGQGGSISKNLRPAGWEMQSGLILLGAVVSGYQGGDQNIKGRPGHSLANIELALRGAGQPPGANVPAEFKAFDVFAGYLVLDAWIANRDRHDENWSVLLPGPADADTEPMRLCGTYDQAGGLGYNVSDEKRARLLAESDGLTRWVGKGTAYRFEHDPAGKAMALVELAAEALHMAGERTRAYWIGQVMHVTDRDLKMLVDRVPKLSEACRNFTLEILRVNRERVLNVCG